MHACICEKKKNTLRKEKKKKKKRKEKKSLYPWKEKKKDTLQISRKLGVFFMLLLQVSYKICS